MIESLVVASYAGAAFYFYMIEKDLLIASLNTYAPVHVGNFETASVFSLLIFMTLGYLGGLKRLIFALFTYHVPVKMLRGEYERYFSESGEGQNVVTVALGLFLLSLSVAGCMALKYTSTHI